MTVTVKIFTKQGGRPTLFQTRDFETLPVTIGRDATCTVALDDPMKHISRVHVELQEEDGTYWMSVVSKVNPVMVKGRRYGPGTRLTLHSGDSFEMGEFEVQVTFTEKPRPLPPREKKSLIQALVEDDPAVTAEIPPPEPGLFDEPTPMANAAEPTYLGPAAKPAPVPAPATPAAGMNDALRVFLEGAGMPHQQLSAMQSERLLRDSGALLRAAVEGLIGLVIARSEMRQEFEGEQGTMVAARDKNPLNLMADPDEAMKFLFDPGDRTDGFLDPLQAISDASDELRSHQLAVMAGMRAAVLAALRRFDPADLEKAFDKSAGFSLGSRKAKLWDVFLAQQQKLTQDAQADFNKLFGRDFMRGYQTQLRKLPK
jgi:type VI secretion system FHA domain protein